MAEKREEGHVDPIVVELTIARQSRFLSRRELAPSVGYAHNSMWAWENGSKAPSIEAVSAYAAALGKRLVLEDIEAPEVSGG